MATYRTSHGKRLELETWMHERPRVATHRRLTQQFGSYALKQAVKSGAVVRVLPELYAAREHASEPEVRTRACALWAPRGAALGGTTALALHAGVPLPEVVHLVVPHHSRAVTPSWLGVRWLDPLPVVAGRFGPMLTPGFALVDAWHRSRVSHGHDVFYRALWDGAVTCDSVWEALPRFPRVRRRRSLARLLELAGRGATSPLEVLARTRVFVGRSFSAFEWQAPVTIAGRFRVVDMLHREAKVAVEFDGRRYHDHEDGWAFDRERDVEFSVAGYTTLRFTYSDLVNRPAWCRAQVSAVLRTRSPRLLYDAQG